MDKAEFTRLREKYARMSDEEIRDLLMADKKEFEPEAYTLLSEEAGQRRIAAPAGEGEPVVRPEQPAETVRPEESAEEDLVQLMIINDRQDRDEIDSALSGSAVVFYFQPINLRGKELPVALLVDQRQADSAIDILRNIQPRASIPLW